MLSYSCCLLSIVISHIAISNTQHPTKLAFIFVIIHSLYRMLLYKINLIWFEYSLFDKGKHLVKGIKKHLGEYFMLEFNCCLISEEYH